MILSNSAKMLERGWWMVEITVRPDAAICSEGRGGKGGGKGVGRGAEEGNEGGRGQRRKPGQ